MNYQTIIASQEKVKDWNSLIANLNRNGVLWVICEDGNEKDKIIPKTFELIDELTDKELRLKNIILWINRFEDINSSIINIYKSILFFVKSEDYYFDKNYIREKHIWKNVEWGKRAKNYNPKGKDPGNLWILTKDDGKGRIIGFEPLNLSDVIERCILCSTKEGENVLLKIKAFQNNLDYLKRKIKNE